MKKIHILLFLLAWGGSILPLAAQADREKEKKTWEFGLGGSVFQINRVGFSNFAQIADGSYLFDLKLKHTVYGGNIYVARELNEYFYLDLQGTVGTTKQSWGNNGRKWLYTAGLGLQWRLGEYFNSKYIDPYLRAGANYMRKDFDIYYAGSEGLSPDEMKWVMDNLQNKNGNDRKNLIPIAMGIGLNMWLNDRWGIGMQGDYLLMPYKNVANTLQGTVRVMYRLGGKSKKPAAQMQYVDVERIVERRVEMPVEKIVEIPARTKVMIAMFDNIHFDFDRDVITAESSSVLDAIADYMKENTSQRFLITGYTDSRGSNAHNQGLSERRAKAVVKALTDRGVSADMLKGRGVASRIAIASPQTPNDVRLGDRKVTVELITNNKYWEYLTEKGL